MTELEARLRATFTRVAEAADVPPVPEFAVDPVAEVNALENMLDESPHSAVPRRHSRTLAGLAALAILGGGLSVAAAAGLPVLPHSVVQALGWAPEPGAYNAIPASARQLLTVPGPGGVPLHLWYADATDNGYCLTLAAAVSTDHEAPGGFRVDPVAQPGNGVGAGGCGGPVDNRFWHVFGGVRIGASNDRSSTFIVHVPAAATVQLELDDGTARTLPIGDEWTAGWLTHHQTRLHPVLVGIAPDGTRVGTLQLQ